ncbi:MAG: glutamine--tRNA ligase/YqeY domain fusion protein [bacterium]|nr:glutamine--tRNA ligase/YqeY domain fusion protein [bacterium]
MENNNEAVNSNFIKTIIDNDLKDKKHNTIVTRFPPEPNGFLHIGHAKAICINFGIAREYGGTCHLRFDDTNPGKENIEYVESIKEDVRWLGFDWQENIFFASDYFEQMYDCAVQLIKQGKAFVCSLSPEEIREYRGTLTDPGRDSPYKNRSIEENLDLFERMKAGEFDEGKYTLRAKIDMASPNINMRDPAIYRIIKKEHHRTSDKWHIYPMYDYAHCLEDALEGITHSLCSLEFEDHRPLYDWFLDELNTEHHPQQIEFSRLNLTYTVLSKRKLIELVESKLVSGWDDPRMPTISGYRRRGFTPESIRVFCEKIGVSRANSMVDVNLLNFCLREELNKSAPRVMAVLRPLKIIITNYPEGKEEYLEADVNPEDPGMGKRMIPFSKEIYIERSDFIEDPPKKYFRLSPGKEVRLNHAWYITCEKVVRNEETSEIIELHCIYDPETKGGWSSDGRKVKGSLHWVSAKHAVDAEVRLYNNLFTTANPNEIDGDATYNDYINPDSIEIIKGCKLEPDLADAKINVRYQFLRLGYYWLDPKDSSKENLVFNRILSLRDKWS